MTALGPHAPFILAAYGLTALVLGGLVAWVTAEGRRARRRLGELESRGLRRGGAGEPS